MGREPRAEIEPYDGTEIEPAEIGPETWQRYVRGRYDAPSYLDLRPVEDGPIQSAWVKIILWYRYVLHFQLWITERWYRPVITFLVFTMIFLVIKLS